VVAAVAPRRVEIHGNKYAHDECGGHGPDDLVAAAATAELVLLVLDTRVLRGCSTRARAAGTVVRRRVAETHAIGRAAARQPPTVSAALATTKDAGATVIRLVALAFVAAELAERDGDCRRRGVGVGITRGRRVDCEGTRVLRGCGGGEQQQMSGSSSVGADRDFMERLCVCLELGRWKARVGLAS
jgi:hypothetical protein